MPRSVKNLVFQNSWFETPSILMEILGISIEILSFPFEMLGIPKICDNRIS